MLPSYPKVRNLGHRDTAGIFDGPVVIQEKVDGSQISFGVIDGELFVRSRGTHRDLENPGMFAAAVREIKARQAKLEPDVIYRGEYLKAPRHNVQAYDRVPKGHIALFDYEPVEGNPRRPCPYDAAFLGFDVVPLLFEGEVGSEEQVEELVGIESFLGGPSEGVVIKNYSNGCIAKVVCEKFREKHPSAKSSKRPKGGADQIIETYRTEARWHKAVQHLREEDKLVGEPRDIGAVVKEVQRDVFDEHEDEIKDALFNAYRSKIGTGIVVGLAEWYKDLIAIDPFSDTE